MEIVIKVKDLVPFIKEQGKQITKMLKEASDKYGARYNKKNRYEELIRRFGHPYKCPTKFAEEFGLIVDKKSTLPAAVRNVVSEICQRAYWQCFNEKVKELELKNQESTKDE